jgi:hypothetical protein
LPKFVDISGEKFHRLTVLSRAANAGVATQWLCLCDCGKTTIVRAHKLKSGHSKSCGCWNTEQAVRNGQANRKHGHAIHSHRDLTYSTWGSMKDRCRPSYKAAKNYHDRGISVCPRWSESFESFLQDMGVRPQGTTLDRIDVNGNYEPGNCRWATAKEQQNNRRNTNYLKIKGVKIAAMMAAQELGVSKTAMMYFVSVSRKMQSLYGEIGIEYADI